MNFSALPPEVNSARLYGGAGCGPMLAAATAWDGLAAELGSAAASFGSVTEGVAGSSWRGPASAAMTAAAAPYVGWLQAAADRAAGTAGQARAAAGLHEAAVAAAVHPGAVAANRGQLVSLVTSNLLGQNAPAIAATEAHYERMWAQDVAAMAGYHSGASAVAAQLAQWPNSLRILPGLGIGAAPNAAMAVAAAILPVSIGEAIESLYLSIEPWVQYAFNLAAYAVGWLPWIGILGQQINIFYYLGEPIVQALLFNAIDFLDGTISFDQAVSNIWAATSQSINQFVTNEVNWVFGFLPPPPPVSAPATAGSVQ